MDKVEEIYVPNHYAIGGIETFDFIKAKLSVDELRGYCKGTIIYYLSRASHKGQENSDYKKAKWYTDRLNEITWTNWSGIRISEGDPTQL